MKTFKEFSKDVNTKNVNKAIQHDWATHIHHPSLGEVKVESHSLTEDGLIEEYYVIHKGKEITLEASSVKVTKLESHNHGSKAKKKKKWKDLTSILHLKIRYSLHLEKGHVISCLFHTNLKKT